MTLTWRHTQAGQSQYKIQLYRIYCASTGSSQGCWDPVKDPHKVVEIQYRILSRLLRFSTGSSQGCGDPLHDIHKVVEIQYRILTRLLISITGSSQGCWDSLQDPHKVVKIRYMIITRLLRSSTWSCCYPDAPAWFPTLPPHLKNIHTTRPPAMETAWYVRSLSVGITAP